MKSRALILTLFSLFFCARLVSQKSAFSDSYEAVCNFFLIDPNEGLTTFLSTMIPVGGTAASMASVYTAACTDASFLEINPAGSSVLANTELSLYHNNWIADTRIESAVYTMRFKSLGVAVGGKWLYLPFTEYDDFAGRSTAGYFTEAMAIANASYHILPGYYFYGVSLGANVKFAYRSVPDYADENGIVVEGSGITQSAPAFMADFGALTRFNFLKLYPAREKNFSLGLAVKNIGPPALGEPMPSLATFGMAYSPLRPMLFTVDLSLPFNMQTLALSEGAYWGIGYAMNIASFWDLQAGLLLKPGNPRLTVGTAIKVNPLVLSVTYTLDLLTQFSPLNRLSIEARFLMGDSGRGEISTQVDDLYMRGLEAYAKGNNESAIALWRQVLALDPFFEPARTGLETAIAAQEVLKRVLEVQKLEQ